MDSYSRALRIVSPAVNSPRMPSAAAAADRLPRAFALLLAVVFGACTSLSGSGEVGYARLAVHGDLALSDGASTDEQSLGSAFGLGDDRGAPYARGRLDVGWLALSGSVMSLQENGEGVLQSGFGALVAGTPVASDLDVAVGKLAAAIDLQIGPVHLQPGLAMDVFDLDFTVRETVLGNREEIDELLGVPLLFVRGEVALGDLLATGELGWLDVASSGEGGRFLDAEARLQWSPVRPLSLAVGYRHLGIDANGDTDSGRVGVDLTLSGWFVGGGLRF